MQENLRYFYIFLSMFVEDKKVSHRYYYGIDFIRGLSSFSVLIWHYQHFYMLGAGKAPFFANRAEQPFYDFLFIFYEYGFYAVQFFWVISGFVFASVYAGKAVTARSYAVRRFARLYPLHFATLIVVAGLQLLSWNLTGEYQIYQYNDFYHFILNFLFISDWGLQQGYSFNAPIWSVSIEVFIYFVFFFTASFIFKRGVLFPVIAIAIFVGLILLNIPGVFWACGAFFYLGVGVYFVITRFSEYKALHLYTGTVLLFIFFSFAVFGGAIGLKELAVLFVGIIVTISWLDINLKQAVPKSMHWVGNITYSVYLIHVPIQIGTILFLNSHNVDRHIASENEFFIAFITLTIIAANIVYRFFEKPLESRVRSWIEP